MQNSADDQIITTGESLKGLQISIVAGGVDDARTPRPGTCNSVLHTLLTMSIRFPASLNCSPFSPLRRDIPAQFADQSMPTAG